MRGWERAGTGAFGAHSPCSPLLGAGHSSDQRSLGKTSSACSGAPQFPCKEPLFLRCGPGVTWERRASLRGWGGAETTPPSPPPWISLQTLEPRPPGHPVIAKGGLWPSLCSCLKITGCLVLFPSPSLLREGSLFAPVNPPLQEEKPRPRKVEPLSKVTHSWFGVSWLLGGQRQGEGRNQKHGGLFEKRRGLRQEAGCPRAPAALAPGDSNRWQGPGTKSWPGSLPQPGPCSPFLARLLEGEAGVPGPQKAAGASLPSAPRPPAHS